MSNDFNFPTFTYFDEPEPHIIIDNFLTEKLAEQCLDEAISLEPFYEDAKVGPQASPDHHCDECKPYIDFVKSGVRDNSVIYLDTLFKERRFESKILDIIQRTFLSDHFQNRMSTFPSLFPILNQVTHSESILSRYGMCDFYGWHTDTFVEKLADRVITLCYYMNKEPETFEGGELIFADKSFENIKSIKPKHNRAVLFLSNKSFHCVNKVKLNGDFSQGRFSLNYWLGFGTGNFKMR